MFCTPSIPLAYDRGEVETDDKGLVLNTYYRLTYNLGDGQGYRCGCYGKEVCKMTRFRTDYPKRDIIRHETCEELHYYG